MRVLSVDDKADNLYFLETVLRSEGYEVVNARDGLEALEILSRESFDLIVSDVQMPRMDGFKFCRAVRKNPATVQIPFVFYSGSYTDSKDAALAKLIGASRYLIKPMEPEALLAELKEVIALSSIAAPASNTLTGEDEYLRTYNERLVEKLEQKVEQYDTLCERLQTAFDEKVKEVAERLHIEDALRLNEERYRSVVSCLAEAIILADQEGNIVACNDSAARILRAPKSKILVSTLVKPVWNAVREDGTEIHPLDHPLRKCLETGQGADAIEFGHMCLDGPTIWLSANVRPCITDERGKVLLAVMSFTDVTERKNLEEKFLRAQRLESIGILAGGVAHDLNNILSPILLGIPIVRMRVTDQQGLMLLDTMETSANRGAQIVRQILTFSRGLRTEKITIQPRHLLKEIAELAQETFPRNISIEADLPRSLWQVEADTTQLHQVFMNLCVNARDAMPKGGLLLLKAENVELSHEESSAIAGARAGSFVKLSVGDTGTGMAPETLARIFQPFFSTKDVGKGTGLGLSTARGIVLQHNGFMTLESKVGEGSRFDVYLPAIKSEEAGAPDSLQKAPSGTGQLILIVDDEYALRHICESVLVSRGYKVIVADSGQQGLAQLRENVQEVSVVITDIIMPGMSGAEFIPMVKALKPSLKTIAISGTGAPTSDSHSPAGVFADAFLSKPFSAEQLLTTVHEVLSEVHL